MRFLIGGVDHPAASQRPLQTNFLWVTTLFPSLYRGKIECGCVKHKCHTTCIHRAPFKCTIHFSIFPRRYYPPRSELVALLENNDGMFLRRFVRLFCYVIVLSYLGTGLDGKNPWTEATGEYYSSFRLLNWPRRSTRMNLADYNDSYNMEGPTRRIATMG